MCPFAVSLEHVQQNWRFALGQLQRTTKGSFNDAIRRCDVRHGSHIPFNGNRTPFAEVLSLPFEGVHGFIISQSAIWAARRSRRLTQIFSEGKLFNVIRVRPIKCRIYRFASALALIALLGFGFVELGLAPVATASPPLPMEKLRTGAGGEALRAIAQLRSGAGRVGCWFPWVC